MALLFVLLLSSAIAAQEPAPAPAAAPDTVPPELLLPISPAGAFVRSLVLPGWGQALVGAPVRGGIYFAMEAGSLWMVYKSRQKLGEARRQEAWLRETGQLPAGQPSLLVEARRDQVEDWTTFAVFMLLFSAVDAYVAAHLADFQDHVGVRPVAGGGLQIQGSIPVGGRR